jgi:sugar lactone lactonase YvrE
MYFGNKAVVLEYDGVAWRKIQIGQTTYVRGLALEPASGKIFVGGVDELGYLEPGPDGEKVFVSLVAQLPAEAHGFRDIRRVYVTPEGIVFVADQQVMRWREGRFDTWKLPNTSRLQSFLIDGRLLVHHREVGLLRLENGEFMPAALDPTFRSVDVTVLIPNNDGTFVVGTREHGLFKFDRGALTPLATAVDAFLREKKISRGLRLTDGSLALATASSGLVILDQNGALRGRVNEESELQNNIILDLVLDREGGLWLGLNSGIARVEATSALSIFDAANGLGRTTVRDVLRFDGTLFAATGHGVFRLLPADASEARAPRFERITGVRTNSGASARTSVGYWRRAAPVFSSSRTAPRLRSSRPAFRCMCCNGRECTPIASLWARVTACVQSAMTPRAAAGSMKACLPGSAMKSARLLNWTAASSG